ncbi:hypothetical protein PM082_000368 [Marasmius tenuissimus]|nr:hypothetical protein PM082_000368 [Marasmius tenuissimus]
MLQVHRSRPYFPLFSVPTRLYSGFVKFRAAGEGWWLELTASPAQPKLKPSRSTANVLDVHSIGQITKAVALGDWPEQIKADARGEMSAGEVSSLKFPI